MGIRVVRARQNQLGLGLGLGFLPVPTYLGLHTFIL